MFYIIDIKGLNLFPKDEWDKTNFHEPVLISKAPFSYKIVAQSGDRVIVFVTGDVVAFQNSNIPYRDIVDTIGYKDISTGKEIVSVEKWFLEAKNLKILELRKLCERDIINGFQSSALGEPYYYQSGRDDQLNLIGVVTAGEDTLYKCSLDGTLWEYKIHTITQLKQVLKDGKAIKSNLLQKYTTLKNQILNTTSIEELEAIKW